VITWEGTPLATIKADGDRLYIRTDRDEGWITKGDTGTWSMSDARAIDM
jgi:hypothetical protein